MPRPLVASKWNRRACLNINIRICTRAKITENTTEKSFLTIPRLRHCRIDACYPLNRCKSMQNNAVAPTRMHEPREKRARCSSASLELRHIHHEQCRTVISRLLQPGDEEKKKHRSRQARQCRLHTPMFLAARNAGVRNTLE